MIWSNYRSLFPLGWIILIPVKCRIDLEILQHVFKILNGSFTLLNSEVKQPDASWMSQDLKAQKQEVTGPFAAAPKLWNGLPFQIRIPETFN